MNLRSGLILNQYRLVKPLSNTSHPVWLAYDLSAERDVVLKFFYDKKAAHRERVIMVESDHPSIIKLLYLFQYEETTVLVTGHQSGHCLQKIWKKIGPRTGLVILCQIASALDAIHRKGMWHGDVSHLNILYDDHRERAFLLDFAFEKKCAVGFQAPEDFEDCPHPVGRHTDVYRFGRLIELLTPELAGNFQDCFHEDLDRRPTMQMIRVRLARVNRRSRSIWRWPRLAAVSAIVLGLITIWLFHGINKPGDPSLTTNPEINYARSLERAPMRFRREEEPIKPMDPIDYPFIDILER